MLSEEPFAWVVPPVRNWNTRLAVEINPREGLIRVLGFEPCNDIDASPATSLFDSQDISSRAVATF